MMEFLKKHYFCAGFLIIPFIIFIYLYFAYYHYEEDRYDWRHYPISLTETWSKTIEYKTLPHVKFDKCFMVAFNFNQLRKNLEDKFGEHYYEDIYEKKYSLLHITDENFYVEAEEKPHLLLKIYKDDRLVETQDIYFSHVVSYDSIKTGEREIPVTYIMGRITPTQGACYQFDEDSRYLLEIKNNKIIPEYQNVETFFSVRPVLTKY